MSVQNYDELRDHIGHDLVCVCYGEANEAPLNVAVECETCGEVLLDYDKPTPAERFAAQVPDDLSDDRYH